MKPLRKLLLAALLLAPLAFPAIPAMAAVASAANDTRILIADFGLFNLPNSGKPFFTPSKTVPLVVGQNFGWTMLVRTNKPKVKVREELTVPQKPETWGDPPSNGTRSISEDGRVAITEQEVAPVRGMIMNIWGIAPGDPKGHHLLKVTVDGKLMRTFEFDVQ